MTDIRPGRCVLNAAMVCLLVLTSCGCSMIRAKREMKQLEKMRTLEVDIINTSPHGKTVIILVYKQTLKEKELVAHALLHKLSRARFLRDQGSYVIAAFEDANGDMKYQTSEYAGYYGSPTLLEIGAEGNVEPIMITLQSPETVTLKEYPDLSSPGLNLDVDMVEICAGKVAGINDLKFSRTNGRLGLWEPILFTKVSACGVYFLEPYSGSKTPILFVHGAGGYPQEWLYIIDRINRREFQPWVYSYPSGVRLDDAVELLRRSLSRIALRHKPRRIVIVAHSMGGLVARGFINMLADLMEKEDDRLIDLFITISTPWHGHAGATAGVEHSPMVVPSWIDMVPGSEYQDKLFDKPLPEFVDHHLLFGFKGKRSIVVDGNNDGTVTLASQLHVKAQEQATKIYGFNETHTSILRAREVSDAINQILTAPPRD